MGGNILKTFGPMVVTIFLSFQSKVSTTLPEDVIDHVTFLLKGVTLINSTRTIDKELLTIRKDNPAIMYGSLDTYSVHNGSVFAFTR